MKQRHPKDKPRKQWRRLMQRTGRRQRLVRTETPQKILFAKFYAFRKARRDELAAQAERRNSGWNEAGFTPPKPSEPGVPSKRGRWNHRERVRKARLEGRQTVILGWEVFEDGDWAQVRQDVHTGELIYV